MAVPWDLSRKEVWLIGFGQVQTGRIAHTLAIRLGKDVDWVLQHA